MLVCTVKNCISWNIKKVDMNSHQGSHNEQVEQFTGGTKITEVAYVD